MTTDLLKIDFKKSSKYKLKEVGQKQLNILKKMLNDDKK